jgi:hypothetical protein
MNKEFIYTTGCSDTELLNNEFNMILKREPCQWKSKGKALCSFDEP